MSVIYQVNIGEAGVEFRATVKNQDSAVVDVSGTSEKKILFRAPDETVLTKNASFVAGGTDGRVVYTSLAGDIATAGIWSYRVKLTWPSGVILYSTLIHFLVTDPSA